MLPCNQKSSSGANGFIQCWRKWRFFRPTAAENDWTSVQKKKKRNTHSLWVFFHFVINVIRLQMMSACVGICTEDILIKRLFLHLCTFATTPTWVYFVCFCITVHQAWELCCNQPPCKGIFNVYGNTVSPTGVKREGILVLWAIRSAETGAEDGWGRCERGGSRSPQQQIFLEVVFRRGSDV